MRERLLSILNTSFLFGDRLYCLRPTPYPLKPAQPKGQSKATAIGAVAFVCGAFLCLRVCSTRKEVQRPVTFG